MDYFGRFTDIVDEDPYLRLLLNTNTDLHSLAVFPLSYFHGLNWEFNFCSTYLNFVPQAEITLFHSYIAQKGYVSTMNNLLGTLYELHIPFFVSAKPTKDVDSELVYAIGGMHREKTFRANLGMTDKSDVDTWLRTVNLLLPRYS